MQAKIYHLKLLSLPVTRGITPPSVLTPEVFISDNKEILNTQNYTRKGITVNVTLTIINLHTYVQALGE